MLYFLLVKGTKRQYRNLFKKQVTF